MLFGLQVEISDAEVGLLVSNGTFVRVLDAGSHVIDAKIDEVFVVDITSTRNLIFSQENCLRVTTEDYAVLDLHMSVTYKVKIGGAYLYFFMLREPRRVLNILCGSAASTVFGSLDLAGSLWGNITDIEREIKSSIQWRCDELLSGIYIEHVTLHSIELPGELKADFSGILRTPESTTSSLLPGKTDAGESLMVGRFGRKATPPGTTSSDHFEVYEGYQALVTLYGEPIRKQLHPGRYQKTAKEEVIYFPNFPQIISIEEERYVTAERRFVQIAATISWRIHDPEKIYIYFGNMDRASDLLGDLLNSNMRMHIANAPTPFESYRRDPIDQNAPLINAIEESVLQDTRWDMSREKSGVDFIGVYMQVKPNPEIGSSAFGRMRAQLENEIEQRLAIAEMFGAHLEAEVEGLTARTTKYLGSGDLDLREKETLIEYYFEDASRAIESILTYMKPESFDILHQELISEILHDLQGIVSSLISQIKSTAPDELQEMIEEHHQDIQRMFKP